MSTPDTTRPPKPAKPAKPTKPAKPAPPESGISTSLLLPVLLGLIALIGAIALFSMKNWLGSTYFGICYYFVYPGILYLISVGFNAISQSSACSGVKDIDSCFMGATNTLGYLYAAMLLVNLIGPNGVWSIPIPPSTASKSDVPDKTTNPAANAPVSSTGDPTTPQRGGYRQIGGDTPSFNLGLMVQKLFTYLRAPAMSLFIPDPNAATLEEYETQNPFYTGVGVGYWAFWATLSGQIVGSATAQTCSAAPTAPPPPPKNTSPGGAAPAAPLT